MRVAVVVGCIVAGAASSVVRAEPDAMKGQEYFAQACVACHSLEADRNMTGPSLSGVVGRKAGGLRSFSRYSQALKSSEVVWSEPTLDAWLTDPKAFIPGNRMVFPGVSEDRARSDIVAFLLAATKPGAAPPALQGMMGMGAGVPSLKSVPASARVVAINYCGDTYDVTTADGQTVQFWERNLRFKTDSGDEGPPKGNPAIAAAGMVGDRFSVIFAGPEEMGQFIKRQC